MKFIFIILNLLLILIGCVICKKPILENSTPDGYHGLIREDELIVEVKPIIRVNEHICGFKITNRHHGEIPFEIILIDEQIGLGELHAKRQLNCEKRKNYKFDFTAVNCNGEESDNSTLYITVVDVNEYAPVFLEPSYVKQIDEGRLYTNILRVEATDRDCTSKYGDVCKYEITTKDTPFQIDSDGVIQNTEQLSYDHSHNHILSIVAYDCGMKMSTPILVTIKVNRVCQLGWKGIPERIDFTPGSSKQILFPEANLELCDLPCSVKMIETKLKLSTNHIGKGCDRDTYAVHSQRKLCGASTSSIDLLPIPSSMGNEWTRILPIDEGRESDPMFEFDGLTTAVIIPNIIIPKLNDNFSISTWIKHDINNQEDKHLKEHIICSADDHKMNRHHFALFIRNCRLILLIRHEYTDGDLNTFRPAEWRWHITQICDQIWHHYTINIQFPKVDLYIDGIPFKIIDKLNPEIIDDWPLHPTNLNITYTIGACWQGGDVEFKHHFKGYLAGLNILIDNVEKLNVLKCLHKCMESLEMPTIEIVQPGMELITNNDMTEITVEGENKTDIENVIRRIGYINSREFPTTGRRNLHLSTKVICESTKIIKIIPSDSFIMVLPSQKPTIRINGTGNLPRDYEDFRLGVRVFSDVRVTITSDIDDGGDWRNDEPISVIERKLDACTITIYPPINPDHEILTVPFNMLGQLGIIDKITNDGILLNGADMIYNYEQVLRQIQYSNKKPAYYLNRAFKLICSELNGRFTSNEYIQTLTVIHPDLTHTDEPTAAIIENEFDNSIGHINIEEHNMIELKQHNIDIKQNFNNVQITPSPGHAVTVIIVVCVGFLLFMIILGVIRIRAAHQRSTTEELQDAELAWDDSGLNITINPMETISNPNNEQLNEMMSDSDTDSSCQDSDEDELPQINTIGGNIQKNQLDWDPSI